MAEISFIGAEAVVTPLEFLGFSAMEKTRVRKRYRNGSLDLRLRKARTRAEARILLAAKNVVAVPSVLFVGEDRLILEKVDGTLLSKLPVDELAKNLPKSAKNLALLHSAGIVHGDYTVSNQILQPSGVLAVIDFGLSKISNAPEERALDVLTMVKSLPSGGELSSNRNSAQQCTSFSPSGDRWQQPASYASTEAFNRCQQASSYRPAGRFNRRQQPPRFSPAGDRRPQLSRYAPTGASEKPTGKIQSLPQRQAPKFIAAYAGFSKNKKIKAQVNAILSRARYATQQGA
ncbi:Kae1-associated kinase Bud32 [Candidatus Micrarchaeota archaeon CG1_02_49_24]|nr:MAG: Kae1-associated kinase Bud32 [Candidatus Micrarchaeota archaeon CG1_02_49_24]